MKKTFLKSPMLALFQYVHKKLLALYVIGNAMSIAASVCIPLFIKRMIDAAINKQLTTIVMFASILIAATLLFLILETINDYLCEKIKAKTFVDVSKRIISLSQNYSRKNKKPDFNLMLSQNYEIVQAYFFETPLSIVFSIIEIICILIAVCFSFLPFGLLFLIAVPLGVFISTIGQNKINNLSDENSEHNNRLKNLSAEKIKIADEEFFSSKKQIDQKLVELFGLNFYKNKLRLEKKIVIVNNLAVYGFLNFLINAVLVLSCVLIFIGKISFGTLSAIHLYVSQFWSPIEQLVQIRRNYMQDRPFINDFIAILEIKNQEVINEKITSMKLENYSGLDKDNNELNKKLSFDFIPGSIYLITGENGVGKSTLLKSIMGFSKRYLGKIFLNGKENNVGTSYSDIAYISAESSISSDGSLKEYANLSSGQTRKVLMQHLLTSAEKNLLIIDEPTNYLDNAAKDFVLDMILQNLNSEKIILVTTNDPYVINYFSNAINVHLHKL